MSGDNVSIIRIFFHRVTLLYFRSSDSDWDQLMKFALRKAEKFVKTVAIELHIPSEETGENEVYAPRFLDEIADEIDTLENKKDTLFCKHSALFKQLYPSISALE